MIFITLGTQLSFDRLLTLFLSARESSSYLAEHEIIIQGEVSKSLVDKFNASECTVSFFTRMDKEHYDRVFSEASLIISHLGMGTVITAVKQNKSLICLPRQKKYLEHRNDHQIDAASYFDNKFENVKVILDVSSLVDDIEFFLKQKSTPNLDFKIKSELGINLCQVSLNVLKE